MKIQFNSDKPENYFLHFILGSFALGFLLNFLINVDSGILVHLFYLVLFISLGI